MTLLEKTCLITLLVYLAVFAFAYANNIAEKKERAVVHGTYRNVHCNRPLQVSTITEEGKELRLFLEINDQGMQLEIKEKDIPALRDALLNINRQMKQYTEHAADNGTSTEVIELDFKLPPMRLWWYNLFDGWKYSQWEKHRPQLTIEEGNCHVHITKKVKQCSISTMQATIHQIKYPIFVDPAPSPFKRDSETLDWIFSPEEDIVEIVIWLDMNRLLSDE